MSRLWLASGSPRRRALLEWVGFTVDVRPPDVDESHAPGLDPVTHAVQLAERKVATAPGAVVALAADTVVHRDGRIFDKPRDRVEARAHLRTLSGRRHHVVTGVAVRRGDALSSFAVSTDLRFRALSEAEIDAYLATGEADDKAGAYAIQGRGGAFVAEVHGSWTNVMGLPMEEVLASLAALGVAPEAS